MEKCCEQWEDMQVGLKTKQDFKDHLSQAYRVYQIHKKATAAAHGYGAASNNTQETDAQVNTMDSVRSLSCAAIKDNEEMANLISIYLTLSQSLTQPQEKMLGIYKQLQALHTKAKAKTPTSERLELEKNTK